MHKMRMILLAACGLAIAQAALASGGGGSSSHEDGGKGPEGQPGGAEGYAAPGMSAYERAEYLIKSGQYEEAIPLLEGIVRDNPKEADSLNYLGYANRKLLRFKEALGYYKLALAADPDHKGAHEYLGELYLQMGDLDSAEGELAALRTICTVNCEEREDLAAQVTEYKSQHPAGKTAGKANSKAKSKS